MAEFTQELTAPGNTTRPAVCEARVSVILPADTFEMQEYEMHKLAYLA